MKKAIESNNLDDIRAKKDALQQIIQDISMKLYQQAGAGTQGAETNKENQSSGKDDNVVDADFEEVNDDK